MFGSILAGFLCDRLGGAGVLALIGLGQAVGWAVLASTTWLPTMIATMLLIGTCVAGVFRAVIVLSAFAFGPATLPRVIPLYGLAIMPFTFILPPAAGVLRDWAGGYGPMMAVIIVACGGVASMFLVVGLFKIGVDGTSVAGLQRVGEVASRSAQDGIGLTVESP